MKVSDYIIKYIENITDTIFLLSGGGSMHLVDSIGRSKLNTYCCHHEQAATIAAEGYARIKNTPGVVCVTTGPGGTNAITGVAGAWLDSIPMLVISGQVKTDNIMSRKNGIPTIRQLGVQELNIIDLVKPITKYAITVLDKGEIKYHLEKALFLAMNGRPGPVWLDIPLDIQSMDIRPGSLKSFIPSKAIFPTHIPIKLINDTLMQAKRPLLMVGNGIRLADGIESLQKVVKKFQINVVSTMFTADDLITSEYPNYLGRQGIAGNYAANYAVDNCDVLLIVGDRLQLLNTSYDYTNFAKQATKIMVDIDEAELFKKTLSIDIPVWADAKRFLEVLYKQPIYIHKWRVTNKSINPLEYQGDKEYVNLYKFIDTLNRQKYTFPFITTDGTISLVTHQAIKLKKNQRLLTNAGLGHMGSGLPLAIGACIANDKKPVICLEGDGSLMLNIHELQTVKYYNLPIKLIIINNNGYASIRNTHLNYFRKIFAADPDTGVSLPQYDKLIPAWEFPYLNIANDTELNKLEEFLKFNGPIVCEIMTDPYQKLLPKWTAGQLTVKK